MKKWMCTTLLVFLSAAVLYSQSYTSISPVFALNNRDKPVPPLPNPDPSLQGGHSVVTSRFELSNINLEYPLPTPVAVRDWIRHENAFPARP